MLQEFYAVTATAVYRVQAERDAAGVPIIERVSQRTCDPPHALGSRLQPWLQAELRPHEQLLVGVSALGIYLYYHPERWPMERTNYRYLGGHTCGLAALFLNRQEAEACLRARGDFAGPGLDHRYAEPTSQVIEAIGPDHPVFVVSVLPGFRFRNP